eukprot:3402061-Pyramimonas_sp.AAC.1
MQPPRPSKKLHETPPPCPDDALGRIFATLGPSGFSRGPRGPQGRPPNSLLIKYVVAFGQLHAGSCFDCWDFYMGDAWDALGPSRPS